MSNEIMIKIRSDTDTSGFKDAKEGLHDVETASDRAGNAVAKLGREIDRVDGRKIKVDVDVANKNFVIGDQRASVKVDVEPESGSAKRFMSKFGDLAMGAAGPVSKLLGSHIGITVGVAAGVAAAPVLASAIGSALSAGAGAGVIGAGIALAVKGDKSLQAAGKLAGKDFMKAMGDEAKVFAGPVRESLVVLEQAGGRISKSWGEAFDELSDDVVPFVRDVVTGVERISEAFTNVAKGSGGAALEGLGGTWKLLADGVGDFVETVADGGPEAAANLQLVAGAVADLARWTGVSLDVLNKLGSNPMITGALIPLLRDHYVEAAGAAQTLGTWHEGLAGDMEHAAAAARGEREALEGLSSELKAQADPVFAIVKAQDDLAAAQKETAEATKEHGANSAEAEAALQKQALAALSLEANIGKLGSTFDGKMTPAMRASFKAAGLTDGAINRLERQFKEAKTAGDRFAKTYQAKTNVSGYSQALANLKRLQKQANDLAGTYNVTIRQHFLMTGKPSSVIPSYQGHAHGGIRGAASGVTSSGLTLVGEQGPELAEIAPGGRVWSNPDTQRMLAGGGGGGGQGPITVNLVVDGKVLAQATVEPLRGMVTRQASGNAQQFWSGR